MLLVLMQLSVLIIHGHQYMHRRFISAWPLQLFAKFDDVNRTHRGDTPHALLAAPVSDAESAHPCAHRGVKLGNIWFDLQEFAICQILLLSIL